jgi:hypothetical protein
MTTGPKPSAGRPPSPEPELPGNFVSDDLRADCERFLNDLRTLIDRRRDPPPERAGWVPRPESSPEGRG